MAKLDEILTAVRDVHSEQKQLKSWLYGADGHEGDIPEIKAGLRNHNKRIRRIEIILASIIGTGALGGGIAGLINFLGG